MRLKTLVLLGSLVMGSGIAVAQDAPAAPPAEPVTHDIQADVVAVDLEQKTLTMKSDTGDKTLPVEGKAVAVLKEVKAGTQVTLTCKEDEAKVPKAIVDIKVAKSDGK